MTRITNTLTGLREKAAKRDEGFTLIELLVVVLIIGILAAIAIPVYIGIQNSATESAVQSDLNNAKAAVVANYTRTGTFPTALTGLGDDGYPEGGSVDYSGDTAVAPAFSGTASATGFCIAATSPTGPTFFVTDKGGVKKVGDGITLCDATAAP